MCSVKQQNPKWKCEKKKINILGIRKENLTFRRPCFVIYTYNKMQNFSYLFDKVLYVFRTGPLSIIRSISTLYTRNRYLSC